MIDKAEVYHTKLFTRDNLEILMQCWKDFVMCTKGTDYWNKEFPEWSFMISQFQIFINEYEIAAMKQVIHSLTPPDSHNQHDKVVQSLQILLSKLR
jgi:hypothetical protein